MEHVVTVEFIDIKKIEKSAKTNREELVRVGVSVLFIVGVMIYSTTMMGDGPAGVRIVAAAMIGGYMALNIGANDVANNVGPAVGSQAITLGGAIAIAAIFEASGALIAGGDVVGTIKKGIIDPDMVRNTDEFVWLMIAALLAAALWLNFATAVGAPVSTTHAIVGGVLGAGIAAGGWNVADWGQVGAIVASWVISPVLGGAIAAGFLFLIKRSVLYQRDVVTAARSVVPVLIALMAWSFATYLALKGIKNIWKLGFFEAALIGAAVAALIYFPARWRLTRRSANLPNEKASVNSLFTIPLIFAAALLSFAHGANDVANAVGPLAGIADALTTGAISTKATIPTWVMLVGAIGISLGLALYGPRLIRTVGSEITELDKTRAFCIAMAAAITVIIASQLGLPVSSTHIAVGGVFGVGFLREYLKRNYSMMIELIREHHESNDPAEVESFIAAFEQATISERGEILRAIKAAKNMGVISKSERKGLNKIHRVELVRRRMFFRIAAAWIITVPIAGALAAMIFFMLRGMLLP
jgi:PiT family inorganic phosphate transporter